MKLLGELVSLGRASQIVKENITPIDRTQILPINEALGRILAEDIIASHDVPPHDIACKDGYAIISSDTCSASATSPVKLVIMDTKVFAGHLPSDGLKTGCCIQVATGAGIPAGADAVVAVEDVKTGAGNISINKPASRQENIGVKAENVSKGKIILEKGTHLCSRRLGLLSSQGLKKVTVYEKPIVAVLPTGEEVMPIEDNLGDGQIYDVNSYTLYSIIRKSGGVPVIMPVSRDNVPNVTTSLEKALRADMIVTSGSVSVGDKDLMTGIMEDRGKVLFHGIKIKPGRPTLFAILKDKPIMGMPGYPTSCFLNAYVLLGPAIRQMARMPAKKNATACVRLAISVEGPKGSVRFQLVKLEGETAVPIKTKPSALMGIAKADGYIAIPEETAHLDKDSLVEVVLF